MHSGIRMLIYFRVRVATVLLLLVSQGIFLVLGIFYAQFIAETMESNKIFVNVAISFWCAFWLLMDIYCSVKVRSYKDMKMQGA